MPVLLMDLDQVNIVQSSMAAAKEQLDKQAKDLATAINGMVGTTWVAPAANEFKDAFQTWVATFQSMSNVLEQERNRLKQEMARWEDVARTY